MPEVLRACLRPYVRSLVLAGIGGAVAQLVGIPIVLITRAVVNEAAEGKATTPSRLLKNCSVAEAEGFL